MNAFNHFLASFNVLALLFKDRVSLKEILLFSVIFGVMIDLDHKIGERMNKPVHHRRTWIEEPFGLLLIGLPIGLLLSLIKKEYFFLTIIPYALQVFLDYITLHEVSPLAPFSNKNLKTGFFKSWPKAEWYSGNEKGLSEKYFFFLNLIIFCLIIIF